MPATVMIHGSDGEVMAEFGWRGHFFRGKHRKVLMTAVSPDKDLPLAVREALVGVIVETIFTYQQLADQGLAVRSLGLEPGTVLAYGGSVIRALEEAGKDEAVALLRPIVKRDLEMLFFVAGTYEFIDGA